jgi:ABC-2 type transport system permease protein
MVSNSSFFAIWLMFAQAIGVVNGWGMAQTFGALSISILTFGITHSLFGSLGDIYRFIHSGALDSLLVRPKNIYLKLITFKLDGVAFGDLLQGAVGLGIYFWWVKADWAHILLVCAMIPPACMVHVAFIMMCDTITFWLPQASNIGRALRDLIMLPSTQPISLIKGVLRWIYLLAIPALVQSGLPIEALTYNKWYYLLLAYAIGIFWVWLSVWVFKKSLRRYESGNFITA